MPDDLGKSGPEDGKRIGLSQQWEIDDWCKKLGVTETKLREAVDAVGDSAEKVRKYLSK